MKDFANALKIILRPILKYYLKYVTKLVLFIHRPVIIGISGSLNKIFVKNEIKNSLLNAGFYLRSNPKNFNTEIGLPLAILNLPSGYNNFFLWLPIIWRAFLAIFTLNFPKILVLELGIAVPGDMKYLKSLINLDIAIISEITQRYIDNFSGLDELVGEYEYLIKSLLKNNYLIVNYDNQSIRRLAKVAKAKTIFFSLKENKKAEYFWSGAVISNSGINQTIKIQHNNLEKTYQLNYPGRHHLASFLIAQIVKDIITNIDYATT